MLFREVSEDFSGSRANAVRPYRRRKGPKTRSVKFTQNKLNLRVGTDVPSVRGSPRSATPTGCVSPLGLRQNQPCSGGHGRSRLPARSVLLHTSVCRGLHRRPAPRPYGGRAGACSRRRILHRAKKIGFAICRGRCPQRPADARANTSAPTSYVPPLGLCKKRPWADAQCAPLPYSIKTFYKKHPSDFQFLKI